MEKEKGKRKKVKPQCKSQNFEFCLVVFPFAFLLFSFLSFFPLTVSACPGCKEALFDPGQLPQKLATAKGYALSIGLLLTVPFILVGGVTALVVRAVRRSGRTS